jgi:hypothetical protein
MVLLTHLQLVLGKCLASSALESMAIATKCVCARVSQQRSIRHTSSNRVATATVP